MAAAVPQEPGYEVVWPLGRKVFPEVATQDRVADLSGKTVAEFWDYLFRGEDIFPILRERLSARYPGIRFVTYDTFGNLHGPNQRELVARVPDLLKAHKVDAVISAIGA
ncbi:UGSC family (seleno)protein [Falsiroseomonas sp. CW058]|uniref:UGSC family (seleno)protein n=1 Tax=Falsiroseomonas sp. CW058 TaxID=3388664 RepID=UPI003D314F49